MTRPLAKSLVVLLAFGLSILASLVSLAQDDDPEALGRQADQLIEQRKYQEAIPIAEREVAVARRKRGPEDPETAAALNRLGFVYYHIGDYAKAEALYQEALKRGFANGTPLFSLFPSVQIFFASFCESGVPSGI